MLIYANPSIFLSKFRSFPLIIDKQLDCIGDFIRLGETISGSSLQEFSNKNDLKLDKSDYYNKSVLFLHLSEYQRVSK